MNPAVRDHREPRSQVIFRFTQLAIRRTALCRRKFAACVAELYQAQVAPGERVVEFHSGTTTEQLLKAEKANDQLVRRFMEGAVKLPSDLEEAWVEALPEPFRSDCRSALAERYGLLAAPAFNADELPPVEGAAQLAKEFGEAIQSIAPILADGRIDQNDLPHIGKALKETHDLMGVLMAWERALLAVKNGAAKPSS